VIYTYIYIYIYVYIYDKSAGLTLYRKVRVKVRVRFDPAREAKINRHFRSLIYIYEQLHVKPRPPPPE